MYEDTIETNKTFKRCYINNNLIIIYNSISIQGNHNYQCSVNFVDIKKGHLYMKIIAVK